MKDLTTGSIPGHLIAMALPMAIGMLLQTLYYLVDLYFVGQLGEVALAGVSAAGNAMMIIIGLTQILGVGAVALISQAVGRKDQQQANLVFNQSLVLAALLGLLTLVGGYLLTTAYLGTIAADAATIAAGTSYLYWFIPSMALQFPLVAIGAALRGTGIVKPTMVVQMLSVIINIILAPILIAGWGTGRPMGVAGAGLASTIAVGAAVLMLWIYFRRYEKYVGFNSTQWRPQLAVWKRLLGIGIPAGGEFMLMFLYMAIIYWAIRDFGASAQAGFGLGSRIMQALFLPAMAVAFAAPAVAGQNFGAQLGHRVRATFHWASAMNVVIMLALTVLCQWQPSWLLQAFTDDPQVLAVGSGFLRVISWNFVFSSMVFVCSGMFQALGNTWPALLSSATRLLSFAAPLIWLSQQTDYRIEQVWYLSVATVIGQFLVSLYLLRWQFRQRLSFAAPASARADNI